jgi:hypothetical protein
MAEAYGVFVITPPPSETILIGYMQTFEEAKALAMKWADGAIEWQSQSQGISAFGERVEIEEIKTPLRRGKPLTFPKWDEIFETGVFEQFLAPELGFPVNRFGEIEYGSTERKLFDRVWEKVARWLIDALERRRIEAYSLQGREMYPSDIQDMIKELKEMEAGRGPRDWAPAAHEWPGALARAFKKLLKENQ